MKLHNNKETFNELIEIVSDYYKIDPALIEKDYYVTLLLEKAIKRVPNIIFKGGTSLFKCHKIINRFSEDIDLTLDGEHQTQGQKKQMKAVLLEVCNDLNLTVINSEEIRSRRDYNCYKIEYPIQYQSMSIKPLLIVETTYITKAYPSEIKKASSIIYDYLTETNKISVIDKYELQPFDIRVQTLERTLIDKVFAICDYVLGNRIERNSRHIYDLSRLITKVNLDENLKQLVNKVRLERKKHDICYSAKDGININKILKDIIETNVYHDDYENITKIMMFDYVPYDQAIKVIEKLIESKIFE